MNIVTLMTKGGVEIIAKISPTYEINGDHQLTLGGKVLQYDEIELEDPLLVRSSVHMMNAGGGRAVQNVSAILTPILTMGTKIEHMVIKAGDILIIQEANEAAEKYYLQMVSGIELAR